jgi:hypothetical protein
MMHRAPRYGLSLPNRGGLSGATTTDELLFNGQYGDDRMRCEPYEMEVRSSLPAAPE